MRTDSKQKRYTGGQIQTLLVLNCSRSPKEGREGVPGCVHCSQDNMIRIFFFFFLLLIDVK